jgi:hypothetical protein
LIFSGLLIAAEAGFAGQIAGFVIQQGSDRSIDPFDSDGLGCLVGLAMLAVGTRATSGPELP